MRILLAEDEESLARGLVYLLKRNNYSVDIVYNGLDAMEYFHAYDYDALILDIMMPGKDGLSVLAEVRREGSSVPVMMLTAKAEIDDRVKGLQTGADDYLPKPFATSEFIARVQALLRRSGSYYGTMLTIGGTTLDCSKYELSYGDRSVRLANKEFQVTELLFRHPGFVYSTDYLIEHLWPEDTDSDINVVWTHIGYIRRKLKEIGADAGIKTIRGVGYTLEKI